MSNSDKMLPEKQIKIYLAVLVGLLVVAVAVTMFTFYQDEQLAHNEDSIANSESQRTAEESQSTQPVQHNFLDANSQIEKDLDSAPPKEVPEETAEAEVPLEDAEDAAEPQSLTAAFDPEQDRMVWPVSGNVLMDYSPDALIYDATLDLYRTNDSISIGADEAEDVLAAANGVVSEIGHSDELGYYVVLDNGNGYETTYGQLSEDAMVEIGETVAQGETIGRMSEPTWYSSSLGTHLIFTVKANGETVNPLNFLENELDD